jgi:aspartate racemase
MYSVEFEEIEKLQDSGEWDRAGQLLASEAARLERGGADFILLCSNTMHRVAPAMQAAVRIPFVHIADATAVRIMEAKIGRVGLLGTRFTMEGDFYKGRLADEHGLQVIVPNEPDREIVDRVIYSELCQGQILSESRREYVRIIGCTEIGLLIKPEDSPLPVFDTARIHAEAGVDLALGS